MKRTDLYLIALLIGIVLVIFYPLFYTRYIFTDEAVQLWMYRKDSGYQMFIGNGRYITDKLFQWWFSSINTINEITKLRLFSLSGWIVCIPVWYYIIRKIVVKEGLPELLIFFSLVYLITMPPFAIYVSWAAVMELFIANTSGLISGYILYRSIGNEKNKIPVRLTNILLSLIFGCISLFTYQNGFGCFLLPFILHLLANPKITKSIVSGVVAYFFIYVVYYLLFKLNLHFNHIDPSERTSLHINVGNKLLFFLARPLNSAFHFTYLFNEKSIPGIIAYGLIALTWFLLSFFQHKKLTSTGKLKYFVIIFCLLGLIYLPSLVVKENYASNRTLFAIDLAVFFLVAQTFLAAIQSKKMKPVFVATVSLLFVINAWFNFNVQYLRPLKNEYTLLRKFIENNYKPGIDTVYFIRPEEDFFVRKYGITRSWDEFGVPSSFFDWTPEFMVKQIVFEKTGNREAANKLIIKSWLGKDAFLQSKSAVSQTTMLIDAGQIINSE